MELLRKSFKNEELKTILPTIMETWLILNSKIINFLLL
jgi:hypothetical protein